MRTTAITKKQHFSYLHFSNDVTLGCDNTLISKYFTQNLLENWNLGGNLVVDKTLRKLRKATTSRNNDICYNCCLLLVDQCKGCTVYNTVAVSRSARAKTEQNPHNKESKRKKSGKKSCVSSSFMSLLKLCENSFFNIY